MPEKANHRPGIAVNELQVFTPDPAACATHSEDFSDCVYGNGHAKMYQDIASALDGGAAYPVDRDDCLATLRLLHAFYRSDEAGGWVDAGAADESHRLGRVNEDISTLYRAPEE